ncbi:MAG: flagellar basal body-associated FliL family protein [Pseudomonadota bacterium]
MDEENQVVEPAPKKGSPLGLILALFALTLVGAAGGGALSLMQVKTITDAAEKRANEEPVKAEDALAWDDSTAVATLEPVLTNLAQPSSTWVRLEAALVFNEENVSDVARLREEVRQDVLAFLRTLNVGELQGASALNHLRDDLNERAQLATNGNVRELLITSMVLQ